MAENSKIGWTDHTFNPWWGCVEAGPECDQCYARTLSHKYGRATWGKDTPRTHASEKTWREIEKWNREAAAVGAKRFVFVASMGDIMEDRRDLDDARNRLLWAAPDLSSLTFLLLTKRPEMYRTLIPRDWHHHGWPANVWPGTTCGNVKMRSRVDALLRTTQAAAQRWVSAEPLLEEVDFASDIITRHPFGGVGWIVVGGESGNERRDPGLDAIVNTALRAKNCGAKVYVKQDVHRFPGRQGRIPDDVWMLKERPEA